ncbi:MAG: leucine-rich repeat domain-containing protein [Clostridiales bacterium]|nr:leucine-rich repeat domain-containing protein [Clostridiales bacterium]
MPEHIFNGIFTLESVTIEEGVNEIQKDAFACCYSLKHVSLPDSLNFIGERAFGSCDVLDYNKYEGGYYLGNSKNPYVALMRTKENGGMDSIVMPSAAGGSVTVHADTKILYDHSLNGWRDALSVVIPDKITCIGECALNGMSNIENLVVPNSVKYIGRDAFSSCAKLKSITLPAGIENFSYHMLAYCVSLTEIRYGGSAESWEKIDKYSTDWDLNTGDYTLVYLNGGI